MREACHVLIFQIRGISSLNTGSTAPGWRLRLGKPAKLDQAQSPMEYTGCVRNSAGKP